MPVLSSSNWATDFSFTRTFDTVSTCASWSWYDGNQGMLCRWYISRVIGLMGGAVPVISYQIHGHWVICFLFQKRHSDYCLPPTFLAIQYVCRADDRVLRHITIECLSYAVKKGGLPTLVFAVSSLHICWWLATMEVIQQCCTKYITYISPPAEAPSCDGSGTLNYFDSITQLAVLPHESLTDHRGNFGFWIQKLSPSSLFAFKDNAGRGAIHTSGHQRQNLKTEKKIDHDTRLWV